MSGTSPEASDEFPDKPSKTVPLDYQGTQNDYATDDVDDPEALRQAEAELEESRRNPHLPDPGAPFSGELKTVAAYNSPAEAHMAAARLDAEGIHSFIADENLVATDWLYTIATGGIKVQVPTADAERAAALLKGLPRSSLSLNPHVPDDSHDPS